MTVVYFYCRDTLHGSKCTLETRRPAIVNMDKHRTRQIKTKLSSRSHGVVHNSSIYPSLRRHCPHCNIINTWPRYVLAYVCRLGPMPLVFDCRFENQNIYLSVYLSVHLFIYLSKTPQRGWLPLLRAAEHFLIRRIKINGCKNRALSRG